MEQQGLFKLLMILVLILIVLVVIMTGLANWDILGKGQESLTEAEKIAKAMGVAYTVCPGVDRMSNPIEETLASAGHADDKYYRELEGNLDCNIDGTDEGDCIIIGLYRREWAADGGWLCGGRGDNMGNHQFEVDTGKAAELDLDFKPTCEKANEVGCCIIPRKASGSHWLCDWYNYEWTYYGPEGSLNVLVPNTETAYIWSRFADKADGGDTNICTYDLKIEHFKSEKYSYKNGLLKVIYAKCCPEGWVWNEHYYERCCEDKKCTGSFYCEPMGGIYSNGYCWIEAAPDKSCNDVVPAGTGCTPEAALETERCTLHEKYWGAGTCTDCQEASAPMNPLAPYINTSDNVCYYYNKGAHTTDPFDCDGKDSGIKRLCAFKSLCPGDLAKPHYFIPGGTCAGGCYTKKHNYSDGKCKWKYAGHRLTGAIYGDSCVWEKQEPCPSAAQCTDTGCTV